MIEKPINEQFKVNILPVVETIAEEADYIPNVIVIRRNNSIVTSFTEPVNVAPWNNGYLLTFNTEQAENDLFSCEVEVEVDSFLRIFRENWLIVGQSYESIVAETPILVNLISIDAYGYVVPYVTMYIFSIELNDYVATGQTDANGVLSIMLPPGEYYRYILDTSRTYNVSEYFKVLLEL